MSCSIMLPSDEKRMIGEGSAPAPSSPPSSSPACSRKSGLAARKSCSEPSPARRVRVSGLGFRHHGPPYRPPACSRKPCSEPSPARRFRFRFQASRPALPPARLLQEVMQRALACVQV